MHLGTGLEAFKASRTPLGGFLEASGGGCLRVLLDKNMQKLRSEPILQGGSKKRHVFICVKNIDFHSCIDFVQGESKNASPGNCPVTCLLDNYQAKS